VFGKVFEMVKINKNFRGGSHLKSFVCGVHKRKLFVNLLVFLKIKNMSSVFKT
jgi:hypothetical protein